MLNYAKTALVSAHGRPMGVPSLGTASGDRTYEPILMNQGLLPHLPQSSIRLPEDANRRLFDDGMELFALTGDMALARSTL